MMGYQWDNHGIFMNNTWIMWCKNGVLKDVSSGREHSVGHTKKIPAIIRHLQLEVHCRRGEIVENVSNCYIVHISQPT